MNRTGSTPPQNPQGSALILSLIFIAVFAAPAAALHTVAGSNLRIADNFRKADLTHSGAESGLEVIRYWLSRVDMSGKIAPGERFSYLASTWQNQLTAAGITNLVPVVCGSTITISNVPLLSSANQSFSAVLTKIDNDNVRLDATGCYGSLSRTIHSNFLFGETAHTVFDYGVVSKGPLSLQSSVDVHGVNVNVECNGISFSGNAGGVIDGSVINYANRAMELDGNSDLLVKRTGRDKTPAGFVPRIVMYYDQSSYAEAAL